MDTCTATRLVTGHWAAGGVKFYCTRPKGHAGMHVAKGVDGVVVRRWLK